MPPKILLLSHKFYPDIGGIETVSEFLAYAFSNAGYEVRVMTWSSEKGDKAFPFAVVRKPNTREILKEHAWADVLFENNPSLRLAWPNLFIKRPLVVALHTWLSRTSGSVGFQDNLKLHWLKRAAKVIACSNAIRERCFPQASVIGNAYHKELFKVLPEVPRFSNFVFLGRLVSDKGADLAIKALNEVLTDKAFVASYGKPKLTIIGDGPERENLNKLVSALGIENNVIFMGAQQGQGLVMSLNQHKYMLIPSVWDEPFGIVALEGMACGCIPIVSDGGGLADAVGKAGLVFQKGNLDALVSSMKHLLTDAALETELREAASVQLEAHLPEIVAKEYIALLKSAMQC